MQIFYLLALIKEIKVREMSSDVETAISKQFAEGLKMQFARKNLLTVQVNDPSPQNIIFYFLKVEKFELQL